MKRFLWVAVLGVVVVGAAAGVQAVTAAGDNSKSPAASAPGATTGQPSPRANVDDSGKSPAAPAAGSTAGSAASSTPGSTTAGTTTGSTGDRKAKDDAARRQAAYTKTRQTLMAGKTAVQFENAPLKDVLTYLAEVGKFSIVYGPELETAGIDLAARTVTIRASGMKFEDVLGLILPRECGYRINAGYIVVTTLEASWLPLVVGAYNVQLALAEVPDFTDAPRFEVGDVIAGAASQGGGGSLFASAAKPDAAAAATPDKIIELVKKFVKHSADRRIATWDDEGGPATVHYVGGRLVVSQTDHGHRAVAKLLAAI